MSEMLRDERKGTHDNANLWGDRKAARGGKWLATNADANEERSETQRADDVQNRKGLRAKERSACEWMDKAREPIAPQTSKNECGPVETLMSAWGDRLGISNLRPSQYIYTVLNHLVRDKG